MCSDRVISSFKQHENPTKNRGESCVPIGLSVPVKQHENPTENRGKHVFR